MTRQLSVSGTVVVVAARDTVYGLVSDPTATGRWSPENLGATVGESGPGPIGVGTTFVGHNRRGRLRWNTECEVVAADPGTRFAFRVQRWGVRTPRLKTPIATWEYRLADVDGGTEVTETWTDDRRSWPDPVAAVVDRVLTGGRTFGEFQKANIATSLRRLKTVVEATDPAAGTMP